MNLVASQGLGTWVYVFGKIEQTKEEEKAWVPTEEAPPTGGTSCVLRLECGHRLRPTCSLGVYGLAWDGRR